MKILLNLCFFICMAASAQQITHYPIAENAWANNSVNTVIFRKNALVTLKDVQYAAFYDREQYVVLAKRNLHKLNWELQRTQFQGDATDAHKSISIMVDGAGYLHVSWGQHNNNLNYAVSLKPNSLQLGPKRNMLKNAEDKVSYPEFYKFKNGDLLFLYRDGGSGNGNLMINRYVVATQKWKRVQNNLIDGEGKRNAYTQTSVDAKGTIHLSWVWRETPDVASNHDLCYAKSTDGGESWQKSTGEKYTLPIQAENAEYALQIPQKSELINQTAMTTDEDGNPIIAGYWHESDSAVPQYHIVYFNNGKWNVQNLAFRKTAFTLSGGGTKQIPISRPQIVSWKKNKQTAVALVFRDHERGSKVSIACNTNLPENKWTVADLFAESVGDWEPTFDTELWLNQHILDLFVQKVDQLDGEGLQTEKSSSVSVLRWKAPQ